MGTSVSVRSPFGSRPWAMVRASIGNGSPPQMVLADMMVAAGSRDDWLSLLQSPGLHVYAMRVGQAWHEMPQLVQSFGLREAIANVVDETRTAGLSAGGGGLAIAVAERAVARLLLERLPRTEIEAASVTDTGIASAWQINRGSSPGDLVATFLAETMRQLASHFFARDAASLTGRSAVPDARALRNLTRQIGDAAAEAAEPARSMLDALGPQAWDDGVRIAFQTGGARGRPDGSVSNGG
jgi:hypothetical protein